VTNILLDQAAHRAPPGSFALCESEATATMFYLRESDKAPSRNRNQPHITAISSTLVKAVKK